MHCKPRVKLLQAAFKLTFTALEQENTVIQTSVVAGYSLAFSGVQRTLLRSLSTREHCSAARLCTGGFSSFLLGMDWTSYLQSSDGANSAAANEAVIPYTGARTLLLLLLCSTAHTAVRFV